MTVRGVVRYRQPDDIDAVLVALSGIPGIDGNWAWFGWGAPIRYRWEHFEANGLPEVDRTCPWLVRLWGRC